VRHWPAKWFKRLALSAALMGAAFFAFAQNQRPTDQLYALLTQVEETGWTADLRIQAADLYIELDDLNAALAHWEAALLLSPDNELLMRRTAELYIQRGRWPEALSAVRRLLGAVPDDAWGYLHLGMILAPSAPDEAASALRRAAQAGLPPPEFLIEALETERVNPRGLALEAGAVFANAGLYSYAERAFELAATLNVAARGEALASVGLMRGLQGKDGQRWIDAAVAAAPNSPQVHTAAGLYYRVTGQNFESLEAFAAAVSAAPLDPELYTELARSYELIGDGISAAYWYGEAARIAPGDPRYAELHQTAAATLTPIAP
jgi:tetratricopeptide (TPR) repeat protein